MLTGSGSEFGFCTVGKLTNVDGVLYFELDTGSGPEVWTSDGTPNGTHPASLPQGKALDDAAYDPFQELNINGTIYYTRDDGESGEELWRRLEGQTEDQGFLVADINPGAEGSYPSNLVYM
ncbi:MAG: hypothetical protein NUV77_22395, partial [Thermoguttaceae bacterium]|nr:hypothetical protein [Thermoguttaceae bacterium]